MSLRRYLHLVRVIEQQVTLFVLNGDRLIKRKANGLCLVGDGVDVEIAVIRNTENIFAAKVDDATVRKVIGTVGLAVGDIDGLIDGGADVRVVSVRGCVLRDGRVHLLRHFDRSAVLCGRIVVDGGCNRVRAGRIG